MSGKQALWVHGHSAEIERPDRVTSMVRKGYYVRIQGSPSTTNWLHFAVPTPVISDDDRLRPTKAQFRYRATGGASVEKVHLYDGETRIVTNDSPAGSVGADGWTLVSTPLDPEEILSIRWGFGISVQIAFGASGGQLEFDSAGCDFETAVRVCSQRLRIATNKRRALEFPYRSNIPIDVPNPAIERILVAIHGVGGSGDFYLLNGMATLDAAVAGSVDLNAHANTLVVAPQFLYEREYYGAFPPHVLHWTGGRAYGGESAETDLDGDGAADSGRLSSFTVLDTLLDRLSRRALFPNLRIIVVAGQSNGGQFVNRYAATSCFEQNVAAPRDIHMRYVVMNPGSYLYFNGERAAPGTTNTFQVPAGCAGYDNWPHGLADLASPTCPWTYAKLVGVTAITLQYPGRDVTYLNGALDTAVESSPACKDSLQGLHRLQKGEIYFNYLQHYFGSLLRHTRFVIPGVGHNGRATMTSASGLATIFGPVT